MVNKPLEPLRSARDFVSLKSEGRFFHPSNWLLVNYNFQDQTKIRCAWTISRHIGNAVVRNRLRRWGREHLRAWSKKQSSLSRGVDFNLIFKRRDKAFYRDMNHAELDAVLQKVENRLDQLL